MFDSRHAIFTDVEWLPNVPVSEFRLAVFTNVGQLPYGPRGVHGIFRKRGVSLGLCHGGVSG